MVDLEDMGGGVGVALGARSTNGNHCSTEDKSAQTGMSVLLESSAGWRASIRIAA
jgi:hypothetical protein